MVSVPGLSTSPNRVRLAESLSDNREKDSRYFSMSELNLNVRLVTFVSSIRLAFEFSRMDFGTIFGTSISIGAKVT